MRTIRVLLATVTIVIAMTAPLAASAAEYVYKPHNETSRSYDWQPASEPCWYPCRSIPDYKK